MIDLSYYKAINNDAKDTSRKENRLYHLHKWFDEDFDKSPDYHEEALLNGFITELLVIDKENYPKTKYVKSKSDQPLLVGDIVEVYGKTYMITDVDGNTEKLNQGKMEETTWFLTWIGHNKKTGKNELCDSHCLIQNATQYNSGEYDSKYITIGTSQFAVFLPAVEETIQIYKGQRFLISKNKENPIAYKVSSIDHATYNYTEKGLIRLMLEEDTLNHQVDNLDLMIADYWIDKDNKISYLDEKPIIPSPIPSNIKGTITYPKNTKIKAGYSKVFTAIFKNEYDGLLNNITAIWKYEMVEEIGKKYISFDIQGNEITIQTKNDFPLSSLPFMVKLQLWIEENGIEIKKDELMVQITSLFG